MLDLIGKVAHRVAEWNHNATLSGITTLIVQPCSGAFGHFYLVKNGNNKYVLPRLNPDFEQDMREWNA